MFLVILFTSIFTKEFVISNSYCPCDINNGVCDANCSCDEDCSTQNDDSYPLYSDKLNRCPSSRFSTKGSLDKWAFSEIFCLNSDHRSTQSTTHYSTSANVKYEPESIYDTSSTTTPTSSTYNYGDSLLTSDDTIFYLPTSTLINSQCSRILPIQFLKPIQVSTCTVTDLAASQLDVTNFIQTQFKRSPRSTENIPLNYNIVGYDSPSGLYAKSLSYIFFYNSITLDLVSVNLTIVPHDTTTTSSVYTTDVNVHFESESQNPNALPRSGEIGYAYGQPIIVAQVENGTLLLPKSTKGSFPIPFGVTCEEGSVHYTPLLFGVETIGGCTYGTNTSPPTIDFTRFSYFSKLGTANPMYENDWVQMRDNCAGISSPIELMKYYFFYEYVGNVNNPQNRIVSVIRECTPSSSPKNFVFVASFHRIADTETKRYLPPLPKIRGIPRDTFYPF
ncbi:tectonic-1 isoform X1 [Histomonas meleagridis]|uniref:tectonic-1 isoform X1 n=1 Tax=Histomonas meleagridis TaxID=135588 RepID=UPI00355A6B5E|nr:tectonic-1 isoform X1 [Histomonas meleagridis]KAH0799829.1 tectonic-1 isoform X1 [Histomonas meleagridis]